MGFYRVQYSSEMLDALLPGITSGQLQPRDRLGLESDLFALVSPITIRFCFKTSDHAPLIADKTKYNNEAFVPKLYPTLRMDMMS